MATGKKGTKPVESKKTCFIIMPITTPKPLVETYGEDKDHFGHVLESLFVPAVESADLKVIQPVVSGSEIIQAEIIKNLKTADLVLCDMSTLNANVFFELGIRTALNKPVCMVRDEFVKIPFDTNSINCPPYSSKLNVWEIDQLRQDLTKHIQSTINSDSEDNPIWRHYSLLTVAKPIEPAPGENGKYEVLSEQVKSLKSEIERMQKPLSKNFVPYDSPANPFYNANNKHLLSSLKKYIIANEIEPGITEVNPDSRCVEVSAPSNLGSIHMNNMRDIAKAHKWRITFRVVWS